MSRDAKALQIPPLPARLRNRILQGLAVGEPVIVPVADPPAPGWPWRRIAWVGVGVLVIIGGARLMFNNPLYSEMSSLEFAPIHPSAGEEITVTYHATGRLGSESTLKLRAEYQGADDRDVGWAIPHISTMPLTRESDRTFTTHLRLPAEAVYARFAVEDAAGDFVDHGAGMGWELLVYANGNPTYEALRQRMRAAYGPYPEVALETAREATRQFPDRVEAWSLMGAAERQLYGPDASDSLRAVHTRKVHEFDRRLSQEPVTREDLGDLVFYANEWDVRDVKERWRRRLLREAPRSPRGVQFRTLAILDEEGTAPRERLRLLDSLYGDVGAVRAPLLLAGGLELAYDLGDTDESLRWAQRMIAIEPWTRDYEASQLLSFPSLRDTALAWIDREIEQLGRRDDSTRSLFMTRSRYRRFLDSTRFDLLGLKGQALLAMGDTSEAGVYLDSAVARGWDVARFKAAAEVRLAAADTLGAAQLLARIAVDPGADHEDAEREGRRLLNGPKWQAERDKAWSHMLTETLREAQPRSLFDSVRVTRATGDTVDMEETLRGHVTVVSFSYPCITRACIERLTHLRAVVAGLPGAPNLTIVMTGSALTPADWDRLDDAGLTPLVAVDGRNDAAHAFGLWGYPDTFVTDARGVIRYQHASLQDLGRYVMALDRTQNAVAERSRTDARGETAEQH